MRCDYGEGKLGRTASFRPYIVPVIAVVLGFFPDRRSSAQYAGIFPVLETQSINYAIYLHSLTKSGSLPHH